MDKARLIELLNEALQFEYTDVFLYPRESNIVKEKEVAEIFDRFGRMELRHADCLAMQIFILGGKPKWDFKLLDTKGLIVEMLFDHLDRERKAIEQYNNLVEFADKEEEDELKLVLKGIKSEEEDHFAVIQELIKKNEKI